MGCDIHLAVEVQDAKGVWHSVDEWGDKYGDGYPTIMHPYYDDRNYNLFAILANVRNGYGFGGIPTGDGFVPMAAPRGLPRDASIEVRAWSDRWGGDGHSHSWCTLRELLDYDWTQITSHVGMVTAFEYLRWIRGGEWSRKAQGESPDSWCGDVSGRNVSHISEREMREKVTPLLDERLTDDALRERLAELALGSTYCRVEWSQPYYKAVRYFLSDVMPRLWRLVVEPLPEHVGTRARGEPFGEDVRIVFFFDN